MVPAYDRRGSGGARIADEQRTLIASHAQQCCYKSWLASPSQRVLVEPTPLHDRRDARTVVLEHAEITGGIAIDDQKVGECSGDDLAELAGLTHDLGVDERGRADDLDRAHDLRPDEEFATVVVLQLAEQVAAEADRNTGGASDLDRPEAGVQHDLVFLQAVSGQPVLGSPPAQRV